MFKTILKHIPSPTGDEAKPFQMLVSSIDYNEYVGRIAVGKIENGVIKQNDEIIICDYNHPEVKIKGKASHLFIIDGLDRKPVESATVGDIICLSGIEGITIGHTVCSSSKIDPLPFVKISEPTIEMNFIVNDSPFAGREGKFVTSRQLGERLHRETLKDVSLKVEDTDSPETFKVCGRGEMHFSILIETMRREGYEFQVGTPRVLIKEKDGQKQEPVEKLTVDVPEEYFGSVMEKLGRRRAELLVMTPKGSRMTAEFAIPTRGLFGYRSDFLTDTHGEGIMTSIFYGYQDHKGEIPRRLTGSLISFETGQSTAYGLYNAQGRGTLFIGAGVDVYQGMVIGKSPKTEDLVVNICKKKQQTNVRASGSDDALRLVPHKNMSLEESIEFIADDELIEVTPGHIRLRKTILDQGQRERSKKH